MGFLSMFGASPGWRSSSGESGSRDEGLGFRVCGLGASNPLKHPVKGLASLANIRGSLFTSRRLWRTVSFYWGVAAATALFVIIFEPVNTKP